MRFGLPFGAPSYRELVGKTCAVIDVAVSEDLQASDQLEDPRGHIWTVDHTSEADKLEESRLTLFSATTTATLKPDEEVRRYKEWRRSG